MSAALETRAVPRLNENQDVFSLSMSLMVALTRYPFFACIPQFGDDPARGKALARMVCNMEPLHPTKAFAKLNFTSVKIDADDFAKETDGTRYSRTNIALAAHTDSTFLPAPHELVSFHMVRPDSAGGESFIVTARDVVAALPADVNALLRDPVFPLGKELYPVLTGPDGNPRIRYYRTQVDEDVARGAVLDDAHRGAIDTLDAVLADPALAIRFKLGAGEIVYLNNTRVLHGRTGFAPDSDRLMYRTRAFAGCLL